MLRAGVLVVGIVLVVVGAALCLEHVLFGGVQALSLGAVVVLGVVFERWRYQNKNASGSGGNWQPTGERVVDPESGRDVEVLYDARSGERRYAPIREGYDNLE
jgi:hypothetical protein